MSKKPKTVIVRENALSRRLPCLLTEYESTERLKALARATRDAEERERDLLNATEARKAAKKALDVVEGTRRELSEVITTGRETRDVDVDMLMDYTRSTVFFRRRDTGAIFDRRNMVQDELQWTVEDKLDQGKAITQEELDAAVADFFRAHPDLQPDDDSEHAA